MSRAAIKTYYRLTKPGIIYGNVMTGAAGFLFAAGRHFNAVLFVATLIGMSLVIASACVTNNYTDREIDKRMERTKKRALASGQVTGRQALLYAGVLFALGFGLLLWQVPLAVSIIGLLAWIDYVALYGWTKRHSEHSTLVGSLCGAAPILAGYVAVTNRLDAAAWLLFLLMIVWQMPHFYGIGLYRQKDYASAGLPVLSVARGPRVTRLQTLGYIVVFGVCNILLFTSGGASWYYLFIMCAVSLYWLFRAVRHYKTEDAAWGRNVFLFSLTVLLVMSALLAINPFLV